MNRKRSFFAGLLTVLVLAALGYVVYRYRNCIAAHLDGLCIRLKKRFGCRCEEYDDCADV